MRVNQNNAMRTCITGNPDGKLENQHQTVVDFAFAQPIILERILGYVILDENGRRCVDDIHSLRLVKKNWLFAVSTVLETYQKPLYKLTLNAENSLNESAVVKTEGKLLDRFVQFYNENQITPVPTFKLNIEEDFFEVENYKSLFNCLMKCGQGLLTLKMNIPQDGITGIKPGAFSYIPRLPSLKKVKFVFIPSSKEKTDPKNDAIINKLMKALLNKTSNLNCLHISSEFWTPHGIQSIKIPPSVSNLDLQIDMVDKQLQMLTTNQLPNLTCVTLDSDDFVNEVLLNQILEKLRKTLRSLTIIPGNGNPPRIPCRAKFPVMEQLNLLVLDHLMINLTGIVPALSVSFPKLKKLMLSGQTSTMLKKWTTNKPLPLVEELHLQQIEENKTVENQLPLGLGLMKGVRQTFKNVTQLFLSTCSKDVAALQYVFQEMGQLTMLSLHFDEGFITESIEDKMDALFLGVPVQFVKKLKANDFHWNKFGVKDEKAPSIRLLSELKCLRLDSTFLVVDIEEGNHGGNLTFRNEPFLSYLTFLTLLSKMPKLLELELGFPIDKQMAKDWTKKGGHVRLLRK